MDKSSFKITSRFYVIYGDHRPIYVGYTNRTVRQRFREHKHDKDFSEYDSVEVKELVDEKLSFDFTWDYRQTCENADEVSLREDQLVQQYDTQDSSFQKAYGGGQTWSAEKWFVKSNKDNPKFAGISSSEIKKRLDTKRAISTDIYILVNHIKPQYQVDIGDFVGSMKPQYKVDIGNFVNHMKPQYQVDIGDFVKDMKTQYQSDIYNFVNCMKTQYKIDIANFVNSMNLQYKIDIGSFVNNMKPQYQVNISHFVSHMQYQYKVDIGGFVGNMNPQYKVDIGNFVNHMKWREQ